MTSGPPADPVHLVVLHGPDDLPPNCGRFADDPRLASVRYATGNRLPERMPGAEILFVWDFQSDEVATAWPEADALRWVHTASAGVNHLMFPGLRESEVAVTNARGVFDLPMAEYVLGLVLCFAKDFPATLDLQRNHTWRHRETERVGGRHAVVVGTGPIGRAIARQLDAVGIDVLGVGRTAKDGDRDFIRVAASSELHSVLPAADYVVLAAPLTDATNGMIDAAALARMKPTARLINVGRGQLVVESDLVAALQQGVIGGAALDVFENEPLPEDSPLWDMANAIVSPHMSGDVVGWREQLVELFADNLNRYLAGCDLRNVVDKQRGYVSGP